VSRAPSSSARAFLGALACVTSGVLGCASEQPSLGALVSAADARIRRGPPDRRADATTTTLLAAPLTPDSATRVALLNNRRLRAEYEKLGVAQGELVHALRMPNPTAEAALRFKRQGEPGIELMATIGLGELAFLPLRSEAANAAIEADRLALVASIVDLAFDVRSALIDYQAREQSAELLRTALGATQASAEAATRLHEAGNLTDLDLATERAFNEEARVASRRAESARSRAKARLSALMGLGTGTEWTAPARLPDPPAEERPLDDLERRALAQNLDLAIAKQRARSAEKRATLARTEGFVPELKAGIVAERDDGWEIGPVAEIELPLFYQGQGEVSAARAEMRSQADLHAQLSLEVRHAARTAAERLRSSRASALEYRDVLLPLRERMLDQTVLSYNAMSVGLFQLLAAKRAELETAHAYVELLSEYWHARADVERLEAGRIELGPLSE
jgi:cobalt-zinc-cadmium efflux system outer membrane protein